MRRIDDTRMVELLNSGMLQKDIAKEMGFTPAGICKRIRKLFPERFQVPESFQNLTEKEQVFAVAKAKGATNIDAAMGAFDCSTRDSAKSFGCELMKRPEIQQSITDLMNTVGLTRLYRVKKLRQHVDHLDPNVSLKALDQSWKLGGDYQEKPEVNIQIDLVAEFQALREIRQIKGEIVKVIEQEGGN